MYFRSTWRVVVVEACRERAKDVHEIKAFGGIESSPKTGFLRQRVRSEAFAVSRAGGSRVWGVSCGGAMVSRSRVDKILSGAAEPS
eukprot:3987751-Pleurochrysis_carterae.AAC.8